MTEAMTDHGLWFVSEEHIGETCRVWWWDRYSAPGAHSDLPKDHPVRRGVLAQQRERRRVARANQAVAAIYYCGEAI